MIQNKRLILRNRTFRQLLELVEEFIQSCYLCILCWAWIYFKSTRVSFGKENWIWIKAWKNAFKDILEPMRMTGTHKNTLKTCLSLTSFNLTVVGDLQEKWIFIIMLHAHLAQDREMMRRRSGWRLRGCKSTIRWASRSAATHVSCTVTGALHQPAGQKNVATWWQLPSKGCTILFMVDPSPEQYRETNSESQISS